MNTHPLFILGAPRSGTTFLASLLAETRFGTPVETHFIVKHYQTLTEYGDLNDRSNYFKLLDSILAERAVMQWKLKLDRDAMYAELKSNGGFDYSTLVNQVLMFRSEPNGHNAWGDKTPSYLSNVEVLDELFPTATYIFIVRDGRDVARSLIEREWGPNNLYTASLYWASLNKKTDIMTRLRSAGRLYDVSYEELVSNTETVTINIAAFLGEELSQDTITRLAKTVRCDSRFKWKHEMSNKDRSVFESESFDILKLFGYETFEKRPNVSRLAQYGYLLHNRLVWIKFMVKTNLVDGFKIKFLGKEPFSD